MPAEFKRKRVEELKADRPSAFIAGVSLSPDSLSSRQRQIAGEVQQDDERRRLMFDLSRLRSFHH